MIINKYTPEYTRAMQILEEINSDYFRTRERNSHDEFSESLTYYDQKLKDLRTYNFTEYSLFNYQFLLLVIHKTVAQIGIYFHEFSESSTELTDLMECIEHHYKCYQEILPLVRKQIMAEKYIRPNSELFQTEPKVFVRFESW